MAGLSTERGGECSTSAPLDPGNPQALAQDQKTKILLWTDRHYYTPEVLDLFDQMGTNLLKLLNQLSCANC